MSTRTPSWSQSKARTVEEYLDALPEGRKQELATLREVILENLPAGYEEGMQYGMIGYFVPLERYPETYNGQPLAYVNLASQKNYISLYLMGIFAYPEQDEWFREQWTASGKKLNMGKSCVRFRKLDDVPLDVVGQAVAMTSVDEYIATYERSRGA